MSGKHASLLVATMTVNSITITDGAENVLETYTHGVDLSGHLGGAAGGILSSTQNASPAYYHYDFNGNIVQVTSATQTPSTQITYTPFGEVLLKEGPFTSRYQFSTKEHDPSTKLTYYGYRFYAPALGRWINADPIGDISFGSWILQNEIPRRTEQNASKYIFCENHLSLHFDVLGLQCQCIVDARSSLDSCITSAQVTASICAALCAPMSILLPGSGFACIGFCGATFLFELSTCWTTFKGAVILCKENDPCCK